MFSKWWKEKKKAGVVVVLLLLGFMVFFAVLVIDGRALDRWIEARSLRLTYDAWVKDGSPEPPPVERYIGASKTSTTFVYTATKVIEGKTYQGIFGHRSTTVSGMFVITRDGRIFVEEDSGRIRWLKIHKTKVAW